MKNFSSDTKMELFFFKKFFTFFFFFFFFFSFFDVAYNKILKGYGDFKPAVIVHKNWGGGLPNRF